jgi:putative peptide zinc metalloprotease protein
MGWCVMLGFGSVNSAMPKSTADLPRMRTDLQFIERSEGSMIYDPLLHRYLRIDRMSFGILKALKEWSGSKFLTPDELLERAETVTSSNLSPEQIDTVLQAAAKNGLLQTKQGDGWKAALEASERQQQSGWKWLLHNYISFRIPVIKPETLLDRSDSFLRLIFSPVTAIIFGLLALATLYLVSRQWTEFSSAVRGLTEAPMLLGLGATILVIKLWHEMGHGHFARRYGCRVPTAGFLFILGAPLFYTDVTDAWRLQDRRQRMMIAAAGVLAEGMLAILALTLWVFLQDGLLRNIAFFVASGSLITTLLINLSPFMRFDGYFLLSDWLRIPNLHDRAFEAMKWYGRRILLGFRDPLPQQLWGLRPGALALFGVATAFYRLALFLGIALFVYYAFFKLLGLFLFAVEIAWFILMPLKKELKLWQARGKDIRWFGAGGRTAFALIIAVILLVMPLSTSLSMKAVLEPAEIARAHPVSAATIKALHVRQGDKVKQGDLLFELHSPQLMHQKAMIEMRLALANARLARAAADINERGQLTVLVEEERSLLAQYEGVKAELNALVIRAPINGIILEIDREIHPGRTVAVKDRLVLIGSEQGLSARSYAGSEAKVRMRLPSEAVFIAENPYAAKIRMVLTHIAVAPSTNVEPSALVAGFGGDVPAVLDRQGRHVASVAAYNLISTSDELPQTMAIRGTIHITAASESLGLRALKRAASVIIRESGV